MSTTFDIAYMEICDLADQLSDDEMICYLEGGTSPSEKQKGIIKRITDKIHKMFNDFVEKITLFIEKRKIDAKIKKLQLGLSKHPSLRKGVCKIKSFQKAAEQTAKDIKTAEEIITSKVSVAQKEKKMQAFMKKHKKAINTILSATIVVAYFQIPNMISKAKKCKDEAKKSMDVVMRTVKEESNYSYNNNSPNYKERINELKRNLNRLSDAVEKNSESGQDYRGFIASLHKDMTSLYKEHLDYLSGNIKSLDDSINGIFSKGPLTMKDDAAIDLKLTIQERGLHHEISDYNDSMSGLNKKNSKRRNSITGKAIAWTPKKREKKSE